MKGGGRLEAARQSWGQGGQVGVLGLPGLRCKGWILQVLSQPRGLLCMGRGLHAP